MTNNSYKDDVEQELDQRLDQIIVSLKKLVKESFGAEEMAALVDMVVEAGDAKGRVILEYMMISDGPVFEITRTTADGENHWSWGYSLGQAIKASARGLECVDDHGEGEENEQEKLA